MKTYLELINKKSKIAVVGLGYVGLPLAVEFGKIVRTIGFDINKKRVSELKRGKDRTGETSAAELKAAKHIEFSDDPRKLRQAKFIIVAVPTPITGNNIPDLYCMTGASELVGRNLSRGSIVVFESTVYPGVTEDVCVPILEKASGLKYLKDFKVGYSPERINPGDKEHTLARIIKVVSGCDKQTLEVVAEVYSMVAKAGVFRAQSIKVAEAAKVIENTQRDLNIALMNELALIFHKMGIDTKSVLEAAGTKWNFIKMHPGLVGGHCIGVDPYYLTFKAEELGYHPQVILAGRRINDSMAKYIAEQTVKLLIEAGKAVKGAKVIVFGITFKENVSDIRNSKVVDMIRELKAFGLDVMVCDPLADPVEVKHEYGIKLSKFGNSAKADCVILAVNHDEIRKELTPQRLDVVLKNSQGKGVVVDVQAALNCSEISKLGLLYWRL